MGARKRKQRTSTTTVVDGGVDDTTGKDAAAIIKKAKVKDQPKVVQGDDDVKTNMSNAKDDKPLANEEEKKSDDLKILEEVKAKTLDAVETSDGKPKSTKGSKDDEEEEIAGDDDEEEELVLWSVTGSTNEEIHDEIKKSFVSNVGVEIFDMLLNDGAHCTHHLANRLNTTTSNPTFFYVWKQLLVMGIVVNKKHSGSEKPTKPLYRLHYKIFPYGDTPPSAKQVASTEPEHFVSQKPKKKKAKAKTDEVVEEEGKQNDDGNIATEKEGESSEGASTAEDSEKKDAEDTPSSVEDTNTASECAGVEEGEVVETGA